MKHFFRNYSLASLVIVCLVAIAIFMAYRGIVIRSIKMLAESSSASTARTTLYPIRQSLARYLDEVNKPDRPPASVELPDDLEDAIAEVMRDSRVVRVKIYNRRGVVAFSTNPGQVGNLQAENPGFVGAMAGKVSVKLVYRDQFNTSDQSTESDNLVQVYLPVRSRAAGPVVGVFETYTDVNPLVKESENSEVVIALVIFALLGGMYAALLMFVARSDRLIRDQQRIIREKSELLEQLSHQNMTREELERKRLATDLHEGLAQTLGAVKLVLEGSRAAPEAGKGDGLQSLIPVLQNAINQARAIAIDLSPPSLDDLGLGPTLRSLRGEFERDHPATQVDLQVQVAEADIPAPLKIVIYRAVEAVLKLLDRQPATARLQIRLERRDAALVLLFRDDAGVLVQAMAKKEGEDVAGKLASVVRERVIISGGQLSMADGDNLAPLLRAEWALQREDPAPPASPAS